MFKNLKMSYTETKENRAYINHVRVEVEKLNLSCEACLVLKTFLNNFKVNRRGLIIQVILLNSYKSIIVLFIYFFY